MDDTVRICLGAIMAGAGGFGIVLGVWKRRAIPTLYSLAYAALGIVLLLPLYEPDKALGGVPVLIGAVLMPTGVKARSANTIAAAVACVVVGVGVLFGLIRFSTMFGGYYAVYGGWGLARAIKIRAPAGIMYYGGATAMGIGILLLFSTRLFTIPFVLVTAGSITALVSMAREGWRIPWPRQQQSPSQESGFNTDN